jgi:hypothetical protein
MKTKHTIFTPNTSAVNIEFETDVNNDIFAELKEVRKRHSNQFSCAYLNINSFGYTFCSVKELCSESWGMGPRSSEEHP